LDRVAFTAITCRGRVKLQITTMLHESIDRRGAGALLTSGPSGSMTNDQSAVSSFLMTLRMTVRLTLVAAYSYGRRSGSSRDCASSTGSNVSPHLEDAELPLHERNDPPVVEVRENRGRGQPGVRQSLQRLQG
jgi:hypothetical protein